MESYVLFFFLFFFFSFFLGNQSCTNVLYTIRWYDRKFSCIYIFDQQQQQNLHVEYPGKNALQVIDSDFDLNPTLNFFI